MNMRIFLGAALCLLALGACKKDAPQCPDISVAPGCTARCSRVKDVQGDKLTVCARQLMVQEGSRNEILKSDIQQVQTRKLPAEQCFPVEKGAIADQAVAQKLKGMCEDR
jgi:hypothetical protein